MPEITIQIDEQQEAKIHSAIANGKDFRLCGGVFGSDLLDVPILVKLSSISFYLERDESGAVVVYQESEDGEVIDIDSDVIEE